MRLARLAATAALVIAPFLAPTAPPAQTLGVYDGFGGEAIDPRRWRGYEHTVPGTHWRTYRQVVGGQYEDGRATLDVHADWFRTDARNTERRRDVVAGALELALTTAGFAAPHYGDWFRLPTGRIGLKVADRELADGTPPVRALAATVTLQAFAETRTCTGPRPSKAAAGLVGVFFNDGSSTEAADRSGDIMATLMVEATAGTSRPLAIVSHVWRCADRACDLIRPIGSATFTQTAALGTAVALQIRWQPDQTRFAFRAAGEGIPAETRAVRYDDGMATERPVGFAYDVRLENRPDACHWVGATTPRLTVSSQARIDNVRLDQDAATAAR